jgi:phage-related protein
VSTWDDLLIDGTSLSSLAVIEDFSGIMMGAPVKADHIDIPGRPGLVFVASEYGAYNFPVPVVILGDTLGEVNANHDTLVALLDTRTAPLTLTRRRTIGTGGSADTDAAEECSATVNNGWDPDFIGTGGQRMVLEFTNMDGAWTPVVGP